MATRTPAGSEADAASGPVRPRWLLPTSLVLCVIGIAVATYLSYEHATGNKTLICTDAGPADCLKVTTSDWSKVFGISVAYLGLLYFIGMLVLCLPVVWRRFPQFDTLRIVAAAVGLVFVLYLVWAEIFKIGAICLWCTVVHVVTFVLLIVLLVGKILTIPADQA